jgi:hypothetical protein
MTSSVVDTPDFQQSLVYGQWQRASWDDSLTYRDILKADQFRLFFHQGYLLVVDMGWEGIDHSTICDLFTLIFGFWFSAYSEQPASSLGRCLLEKHRMGQVHLTWCCT